MTSKTAQLVALSPSYALHNVLHFMYRSDVLIGDPQIGSSSAISDITPAAGWTILDCDPNAISQEIRLVCTGDEETCNHIYQGGCQSTLVRLPENARFFLAHFAQSKLMLIFIHSAVKYPSPVS